MRRRLPALLAASCFLATPTLRPARAADDAVPAAVRAFLDAPTDEARAAAAAAIVARKPAFGAVASALAAGRAYAKDVPTGWLERTQRCGDGKDRPYLLYVPPAYDPAKRYRLVVDLHGGVSRPALLTHEELRGVAELRGPHAEAHGYLLALPTGEAKAEWWTPVGVSNVLGIVAATKRVYDVDEDLVTVTGFSDGASGTYYLALTHPTPFASFVPLNGHLGVAGAGGLQVHLDGLLDRPVYAVNTDLDSLYPSVGVAPIADALKALGAPFQWHEVKGFGHDPSYLATERAALWAWEEGVRRVPHPAHLVWAGAADAPSRVFGLGHVTVSAKGTTRAEDDVNPLLPPGRVRLGVVVDAAFSGEGVRIGEVGDDTPAKAAGLAAGDVIVGLGDAKVANQRDLRGALSGRKPGDTVKVSVRRGDATVTKDVTFPEAGPEPAFRRGKPFGVLEATRAGNAYDVTCRGVEAFELWLGVGAVDPAAPVVVRVNGVEAFRAVVPEDLGFLLERASADDDRTMLYSARVVVKVPSSPPPK